MAALENEPDLVARAPAELVEGYRRLLDQLRRSRGTAFVMHYTDGTEVREWDILLVSVHGPEAPAVVLKVIAPGTEDANDWSLPTAVS